MTTEANSALPPAHGQSCRDYRGLRQGWVLPAEVVEGPGGVGGKARPARRRPWCPAPGAARE